MDIDIVHCDLNVQTNKSLAAD